MSANDNLSHSRSIYIAVISKCVVLLHNSALSCATFGSIGTSSTILTFTPVAVLKIAQPPTRPPLQDWNRHFSAPLSTLRKANFDTSPPHEQNCNICACQDPFLGLVTSVIRSFSSLLSSNSVISICSTSVIYTQRWVQIIIFRIDLKDSHSRSKILVDKTHNPL